MKSYFSLYILALFLIIVANSCKKNDDNPPQLEGTPGNPRFNLQFTNPDNVDLDLHVLTPNGSEISYIFPTGDGGTLDVDCLCGTCPNGPNENIYWTEGTAPSGTYKYWVEYYGDCGASSSTSSNFTLRLVKGNEVLQTYTGTLQYEGEESTVYTFTY